MNRKTLVLFALSPLLAAACSQPQPPAAAEPAAASSEVATADAASTTAPVATPNSVDDGLTNAAPAAPMPTSGPEAVTTYNCKSGLKLDVVYPDTESATVNYDGKALMMKLVVSASGARYTGEGLEWWTKGSEGTMSKLLPDGTSGDIIETCNGG